MMLINSGDSQANKSMNVKPKSSLVYMRQLDGLRAVAVAAVLVHHLIGVDNLPVVLKDVPYGYLGVRLFFVLSGFLITGILLKERSAVESEKISVKYALRQFYTRRFLRIFPLYYFVIAITLAMGLEETSKYWLSLLSYTFNIEISLQGWNPAYIAHFWSLSVEEQYYVFWPWVILLAPRKHLISITLCLVALAPIYRCFAYFSEFPDTTIYAFTSSSLDALGAGSLLAIVAINREGVLLLDRVLSGRFALLLLTIAVLMQVFLVQGYGWAFYVTFFELFIAIFFIWLVWHASTGFSGIGGRILENDLLVYLGKISYGIYVYHLFSPLISTALLSVFDSLLSNDRLVIVLNFAITIVLASLSWHFMESPINNLKRKFEYLPGEEQEIKKSKAKIL